MSLPITAAAGLAALLALAAAPAAAQDGAKIWIDGRAARPS